MWNPLNPLASDGALGPAGPLLGGLINELPTRGFDDPVLVGFGGIAVPLAVGETLHHLRQWITLCACVVRVFGESKYMRRKKL